MTGEEGEDGEIQLAQEDKIIGFEGRSGWFRFKKDRTRMGHEGIHLRINVNGIQIEKRDGWETGGVNRGQ